MLKKSTFSKSAGVWCFSKPARQDYNHQHFKSIKNALKIIFLQNSRFLHFSPKKIGVKNNCPETLLNFYPIKCTYLGISLFQFYLLWVRKNEFEK